MLARGSSGKEHRPKPIIIVLVTLGRFAVKECVQILFDGTLSVRTQPRRDGSLRLPSFLAVLATAIAVA